MTSPNGVMSPQAPPSRLPAVVETASSAVAAREKASIEARYLMALHRPRNPDDSRVRLMKRCESPRFAAVAEYSKPVGGGKRATGGSIRLMEEGARQWGNVDVQSMIVFDDDERRIIRVTATDLESNYPVSLDVILEKTVERKNPRQGETILSSRINSSGEKVYRIVADEDAFAVKQGANIAKARRECIRAILPGDLVDEALETCALTRKSEVKSDPSGARKRLADSFYALGVMPQQLSDYLGKPSLEAVTDAELEVLRAIYTGIKEGETTWAEVMEEKTGAAQGDGAKEAPAKGTAGLKSALKKEAKKPEAAPLDAETQAEIKRQEEMDAEVVKGA